jgi:hypothetical protein
VIQRVKINKKEFFMCNGLFYFSKKMGVRLGKMGKV